MIALFASMFVLGLVTSVHCVSMCGPMVVAYAIGAEGDGRWQTKLVPSLAYQGARIASYVLIGLLLGAVGVAFSIDVYRPLVMLVAGAFMVVMGLGMTGKAPWAARLVPRPPRFLVEAFAGARRKASAEATAGRGSLATPATFGLLTGLMPCAPLIAAELAAAGAGSVAAGGTAMLGFGLGSAPLMLAFGTVSSMLSRTLRDRVVAALAIVVIVLGVLYVDRAATRLGSPVTLASAWGAVSGAPQSGAGRAAFATGADGVAEVPLVIRNTQFVPQTVQIPSDRPVRLVVDRQESGACSDQLAIPQLGVLVDLKPNAVTTVELPATKAGRYTLTCGMGMMSGLLAVGAGATYPASSAWFWALAALASAAGALWLSRGQKRPLTRGSGTTRTSRVPATRTKRGIVR